jgi:hypothetical protein
MKPTAGSIRSRHVTPPPRKTRLDPQRKPKPPRPTEYLQERQRNSFWKWFLLVALLHFIVIVGACLYYAFMPAPKPEEPMISLMPPGETVKGAPGQQSAHKLGATTAASIAHHSAPPVPAPPTPIAPPKPPPPVAVQPTPPAPAPFKPILKDDAPSLVADKPPVKPPPPKPAPPKPPKVKVDLHLADGPVTPTVAKPKTHPKKPAKKQDDSNDADDNDSPAKKTTTGLSKEQIAAKLGDKSDEAGAKNATKLGTSGSPNSHSSNFSEFYAMLHDQVMEQWTVPNQLDESAANPVVMIHVERDGRVPPELVHLSRSSGNAAYDDSALETARSLGSLHEPLPDGCPPDISITFKPTNQ